ncbi:hypothetical protein [Undibacterium fentianense]|uniref:GIY-YIG nuclease family protein n=1 Tax=Undibacterium fentianense TaxID=2828728 RepID=A0A941IEE8_9BURK|nr:hypothetical protein [Undibacterium fentianense]MBR7801018.1 hypothetical protein [Undibacterium fentianense]
MVSTSTRRQQKNFDPRALRGIPGQIYALRNSGLKEGLLHIGVSRRSGWAKALELNRDKSNLIPGAYECVFEMQAQDSGTALEAIFSILAHTRPERSTQDFFEIDLASAEHIIRRTIQETDRHFRARFEHDIELRVYRELETAVASEALMQTSAQGLQSDVTVRESIFKKAKSWFS